MTMSRRVGDSETFDDFRPWPGLLMASLWPASVPFPRQPTGEVARVFAAMAKFELAQIDLPWQRGFFHKIDLIVRFRLAGVRIRGHEEG